MGGYTPVHPDTVRYVRSSPCEYSNPTCPASHHILVHLLSLSTLWWSPLALMPRYVKTYVMPTTATSTPVHLDTGRYTPVHLNTGRYTLVHPDARRYSPVHADTIAYVGSSPCEYTNPTCLASYHILVHLLSLSTLWWSPLAPMPCYVIATI